jgi:DNA-binding CsgD family transcriptional regulator
MPVLDEIAIGGLIEGFYEAAIRPELWRHFLAEMAMSFGAEGCGMTPGPGSPLQPVCSPSMDEACEFGLRGGWYEHNPRMTRGVKHFYTSCDIVTEATLFTPWELEHLPFHAEFVNRFNLRHFAGLVVSGNATTGLAFSLERSQDQGAFTASELDALRRLVPHIQGAGRLALKLAKARHEGALDAFGAFDCGALLLDWRGRVTQLNAKAEALMGPWLAIRNGALGATDPDCDATLQKMIGVITSRWPRGNDETIDLVAVPRPPARPLVMHGAPLARSATDLFQQAKAVIWIVDPYANPLPWEPVLRQAFGCTRAEASVAVALAQGSDIDEIAQLRGVSPGTIRAQIKGIFAKTNTRRQAELVALLLRFAPFPK